MDIDSIRLMNNDVLIVPKSLNELTPSAIHVVYAKEQEQSANWFTVLKVSPRVRDVKAGDVVLVPYGAHTPVAMYEGTRFAITDENSIMGVLDD